MNSQASIVVGMLFSFVVGCYVGWLHAHAEVSTECQRQGSFYVGKHDYICSLKK